MSPASISLSRKSCSELESEPKVIGRRIKSARMMAGLRRTEFAEKSGISMATLRVWEEPGPKRRGITKKGVTRLIVGLAKVGVLCSEDWILVGRGVGPRLIELEISRSKSFSTFDWNEEEAILKDSGGFKQNNPDAVVMLVDKDELSPFYLSGDLVGSYKLMGSDLESLVGHPCIAEIEGKQTICILEKFISDGVFQIRQGACGKAGTLRDAKVSNAGKICWHRSRQNK